MYRIHHNLSTKKSHTYQMCEGCSQEPSSSLFNQLLFSSHCSTSQQQCTVPKSTLSLQSQGNRLYISTMLQQQCSVPNITLTAVSEQLNLPCSAYPIYLQFKMFLLSCTTCQTYLQFKMYLLVSLWLATSLPLLLLFLLLLFISRCSWAVAWC